MSPHSVGLSDDGAALVVRPKTAWKMLSCSNTRGYELIAAGELATIKLGVTVITGPSVTTAVDHVITQDPLPGTRVPEGSTVQLKLSSGPI